MAAGTDTLVVRIKAMRCEDCAHKVMVALKKKPGIEGLQFDLEKRTVAVAYDPTKTNTDSICATLEATKRYKPSPYDPHEFIRRGMGLKVDEMKTEAEAEFIKKSLYAMVGMDSVGTNLDKGYIFVRYDANKTKRPSFASSCWRWALPPSITIPVKTSALPISTFLHRLLLTRRSRKCWHSMV